MPPNLQPVPDRQLPTAERLAQLHEALASAGDPHDVILEIGRIGDASSVPFLIEALAKSGQAPVQTLKSFSRTLFRGRCRVSQLFETQYSASQSSRGPLPC
jgi:hypothetical protein